MRNTWKLLTVAALILAGCKGKETKPESKPDGGSGDNKQPAGDTTYTIKLKHFPDAGKSVTEKATEETKGVTKITDPTGKTIDNPEDRSTERVVVTTVLEAGDKRPKKYKEVYEKATQAKDGKTMPQPLEGKTVVYELKGDKYEVSVEGGELPPNEMMRLTTKANKPDMAGELLPKKPVKVGESWNIDLKDLGESLAGPGGLDDTKSSATAKLLKVGDNKVGTLEIKFNLVTKGGGPAPALTFEATGTLETALDGSSTAGTMSMTVKVSGKGEFDMMGKKSTFDVASTVKEKTVRSAEK